MWIHVPPEYCPSQPAEAVLTGPSNWQFQALAQSALWRSKPSPALYWWRRCARAPWLRRLSGQMPEPSMAALGVERWISSLRDIPVNLSVLRDAGADEPIHATSGPSSAGSYPSADHQSSSLKTSADTCRLGQISFSENWPNLVTRLREDSLLRRKLARRRNANGYSSSGWPTATAGMVTGAGSSGQDGGDNLQTAVSCWPTPATRDHKGVDRQEVNRGNARPLNEVVAHWPTPLTSDGRGSAGIGKTELPNIAMNWSTPRASDEEKGGPNQSFGAGGTPLPAMANEWTTPCADDTSTRTKKYAQGGTPLSMQASSQWATPSVADTMGGRATRSKTRNGELLLNGQAKALSSRQDLETSNLGASSPNAILSTYRRYRATTCFELRSERRWLLLMAIRRRGKGWTRKQTAPFVRPSFRRSLNPRFVGDLMGWPLGLTSFECSETASYLFRARMRSALLQLGSPPEAPLAQLSLFG